MQDGYKELVQDLFTYSVSWLKIELAKLTMQVSPLLTISN